MGARLRRPLTLAVGTATGIALVALTAAERPDLGFPIGIALVPVVPVALERLDGPLDRRTARIGAVVGGGPVGVALWLR